MSTPPSFQTRNPLDPGFWDERFEQAFTPWDRGGVPADLQGFVRQHAPMVTLIPGCGRGHEAAFFHAHGWPVTAIDFSPAAVLAARTTLGVLGHLVEEADFFAWQPDQAHQPLQCIYERAFFCALPRELRPQIVARWASLLPPGGFLAGFFFFGESPKGPPFGIDPAALERLLAEHFDKIEDRPAADSIPVFVGKERWQVWRRR